MYMVSIKFKCDHTTCASFKIKKNIKIGTHSNILLGNMRIKRKKTLNSIY